MAVDQIGNEITQPLQPAELSRAEERIKQLSEKVELTSRERDEKDVSLKERDDKIATLERENAFNSGFSDIVGTHSAAKDHKDEIKAKALTGMSVEDATFAVLGKAGKLGSSVSQSMMQVAGGSAATTPTSGQKDVKDMSLAEKRAELAKDLIWS